MNYEEKSLPIKIFNLIKDNASGRIMKGPKVQEDAISFAKHVFKFHEENYRKRTFRLN